MKTKFNNFTNKPYNILEFADCFMRKLCSFVITNTTTLLVKEITVVSFKQFCHSLLLIYVSSKFNACTIN